MFGHKDETVVFPDATVAEKPQSLGGAALGAVLPEIGLLRSVGKGKLVLILLGAAVFAGGLFVTINWANGKDAKAGKRGATAFATALVHNEPAAASAGGASYVNGVRAYFGPVTSATVIAGHERGVNSRNTADERTYYVAEMLIQTRRGPAALELDFDDGAIGSDRISSVHELKPSDTPALSDTQRQQLEKAFAARGGQAASEVKLGTGTTVITKSAHVHVTMPTPMAKAPVHVKVPAVAKAPGLSQATKELSCVQAAHGDVVKMQACTK